MDVEDTPHRVYIADLSAELSDIESDEENPIFLSDIEKHLSRIPKHILLGPEPKPTEHNQVVLYNVPASLSVPEAHDSVRKAIVEARQRIRDRQVSPLTEPELRGSDGRMRSDIPIVEEDSDAMDID
jgi:anthranilate phosphoribosyltransferase